jgi:GNAT superfamily N-acetyltransferase
MTDQQSRPTIVIRERTPADLPAAGAALVAVHSTDGYPVEGVADPEAWLTSPSQIKAWVADMDGRIVGHVAIGEPQAGDAAATMWKGRTSGADDVAVLGRLFVLAAARGAALGERLMAAAIQDAAHRGQRLVLDVMTKDAAAIKLYERTGWQQIGSTQHDDGHGHSIEAYCYVSPPTPDA